MNRTLLSLLVCPVCHHDLVSDFEGDHLEEGLLECPGCSRSYQVIDGVPQMLVDSDPVSLRVSESFGEQWQRYREYRSFYDQQFLDWIAPVEPEFFRGKLVLDGGCGKGRHLLASADFEPEMVVGVDLGEASMVARQMTRHNPRVQVVRADLCQLPFRAGTFDYAYSVGVLHHLPDPLRGFQSLLDTVKPGGHLSAWVYGAENNDWVIRYVNPFRTKIAPKLPRSFLRLLSSCLALVVLATARGIYKPLTSLGFKLFYQDYLLYISRFPHREIETIVYDHLHPEVAFYLSGEEFRDWFQDLEEVVIGWHNQNSWRGFAKKPEKVLY